MTVQHNRNNSDPSSLDELDEIVISSFDEESQLCVPNDRLEDIDFFPNFRDDLISLEDLLLAQEEDEIDHSLATEEPRKMFRDEAEERQTLTPLFSEKTAQLFSSAEEQQMSTPLFIDEKPKQWLRDTEEQREYTLFSIAKEDTPFSEESKQLFSKGEEQQKLYFTPFSEESKQLCSKAEEQQKLCFTTFSEGFKQLFSSAREQQKLYFCANETGDKKQKSKDEDWRYRSKRPRSKTPRRRPWKSCFPGEVVQSDEALDFDLNYEPPTERRCKRPRGRPRKRFYPANEVVWSDEAEILDLNYEPPTLKRKCSHCQSEKTPQWREGPMGPKTLCNACGVRYRTGRLVPEYRPAASPTFDIMKYSNSHKELCRRSGWK